MEGAPYIPEQHNDDIERHEKHVSKSEIIGSLAVETNPEKDPDQRVHAREQLGKTLINKEALQDKTEVNFEQDPIVRHAQSANAVSRAAGWMGSLLSSKSDIDLSNGATQNSSVIHHGNHASSNSSAVKPKRSLADVVMFSVITLLLALIILVIIIQS